jgi:hypothetical protein
MPLDDVWKTFQSNVGVYWRGRFDEVPPVAGVYAWFYPLRVTSYDLTEFLDEMRRVHLFDARARSVPCTSGRSRLGWSQVQWNLHLTNPTSLIPRSIEDAWQHAAANPECFDELRRVLLRSSLLMPPLYVGKAVNLRNRCSDHTSGSSDFSSRFENHAEQVSFSARRVVDLLFVAMRTEQVSERSADTEALVEHVLKLIARPPYGVL